jgi:hypothetical protein
VYNNRINLKEVTYYIGVLICFEKGLIKYGAMSYLVVIAFPNLVNSISNSTLIKYLDEGYSKVKSILIALVAPFSM